MCDKIDKAFEDLKQLKLPPVFERIWSSGEPKQFCMHWCRPYHYFEICQSLPQICPLLRNCVPLLEANGEEIVAFVPETNQFVEYYFGDAKCETIGSTYQQLLSSIFVDFGYAGLSDLVEDVAEDFQYHHLESFRKFMREDDGADAYLAKRRFVEST